MRDNLSQLCAAKLAALAKSFGAAPSVDNDTVRVGGDDLRLRARLENDGQAHGQHVIAVAVGVAVNGVDQPLTAGTVGIGLTRDEALDTAASEWAHLVGTALLGAVGVKMPQEEPLTAGRFTAYPGATGVRGAQDFSWSREDHEKLLGRLRPVITKLSSTTSSLHSISVTVTVQPAGDVEGECRVDGEISPDALKAARSHAWPLTEQGYMFKQYYVVRRDR